MNFPRLFASEMSCFSIRGKAPPFNASGVYPTTTEKSKVKPAAIRGEGHLAFSYMRGNTNYIK